MSHSLFRIATITGLVLALVLLSPVAIVSQVSPVHGVVQSGQTSWAPYGPQSRNMLISFYSDFNTMFNAFTTGQLDITDWPVQPADQSGFQSNPDFFVSNPTSEFGIFHLDINHHAPFLGISQQTPRVLGTPSASLVSTAAGCSLGMGRLVVNLKNLEAGSSVILDPLNQLKAIGPVSVAPVTDDPTGGSTVDGTYVLPSPTTCMLAGTYTISATVYSGSAAITLCPSPCSSGEIRTVNFSVNYNSGSTVGPTAAGANIARGIAHLLDKPNLLNDPVLNGQADYDDIQAPPAQGLNTGGAANSKLPSPILQEDCTGNNPSNLVNPHPWLANCNPVSAYNLQPDVFGGGNYWWAKQGSSLGIVDGYSGLTDIRAACDHFVLAGFTISPSGSTCLDVANASVGTSAPPMPYPHLVPTGQIVMYIRSNAQRKAFGTIVADSLNFLFGTPNNPSSGCTVNYGVLSSNGCTPFYYSITQVFDIVFSVKAPGGADDWNIYTGGFFLGSTPEQLYATYDSAFAGSQCGGIFVNSPGDYPFYCNAQYDAEASGGEFSTSLTRANSFFINAAIIGYRTGLTVPVYSPVSQFVALNGWNFQPGPQSSLVSVLGHGFQAGFWSLLNMRSVPGYNPCTVPNAPSNCASLSPGSGVSGLIRRGFSQDVHKLSPFQALTLWEFEVIGQVYDSMLAVNPLTGGTGQQVIDWMTTTHTSSFNPTEVSCVGTTCVTGTTTQQWFLRNDLQWHDGQPITPDDVVYTIIAYRDVPSDNLLPNVATVSSATKCGLNCVQVKLQNQSPFYELDIGGLPIIPKHLWVSVCGDPPNPASLCGTTSFDPMAQGIFVGSGPWVCKSGSGAIGGPCSSTGVQDVTLGGNIVLTANDNYMRGPGNLQLGGLQKISWADKNDDGVVNILDIADAALHFNSYDAYWAHPIFSAIPSNNKVDIGDVATIAFYFDHGLTRPYAPVALLGIDQQIDPFRSDLTGQGGPVLYYQGGLRNTNGQLSIQTAVLSGTASPSSFTAALKTDSGTLVGTATGITGSSSSIILFQYSGISLGSYLLSITFNGASQPFAVIRLSL